MPSTRHDGLLTLDHRASPGLSADTAVRLGVNPKALGEGGFFETATITCCHCAAVVVKNLGRTRPRASCMRCGDRYLCDLCAIAAQAATYVHRSFAELADLVQSGRFTVSGPSSAPVLTPVVTTP